MGEPAKVGKRGTVVIPAKLRKKFGIEEGSSVLVEEGPDGVVIRPAVTLPVEVWTPERKAAFLLENAVDTVRGHGFVLTKPEWKDGVPSQHNGERVPGRAGRT